MKALLEVARTRGYKNLKDAGFEDIRGFIFVSSAESTTPFHADSDENFFFQIHGDKYFHVYDNRDRSIASEQTLEEVVVKHRNIPYDAKFDAKCTTHTLHPGDGVFVPYQWPHWVRTAGSYSISLSLTWKSSEVRRRNDIFTVNSLLRGIGIPQPSLGVSPVLDTAKLAVFRAANGAAAAERGDAPRASPHRLWPARKLLLQVRHEEDAGRGCESLVKAGKIKESRAARCPGPAPSLFSDTQVSRKNATLLLAPAFGGVRPMRHVLVIGWLLVTALFSGTAFAQAPDLIVEKKTFELPAYTTQGGQPIKNVKVGWQAAGTLNADRSNAILITHFFSGTSHAFGKYAATDKAAGYWDAIIGPGKAVDTSKYYVISSDTLINLNAKAPNVVTTGPASINPDTGKPYGMSFPLITFRDMVNVQKALLESLGITRLKAVVGASMGALQAYEWAASYPQMVERIVPVIGHSEPDSFLIAWLGLWAQPITLDPKWKGGDYDPKDPPTEGLKAALKLVTLQANHWQWVNANQAAVPAKEAQEPGKAFDNKFKVEAWLDAAAAGRAAVSDANHFLYLVKANQLAAVDASKLKVPTLLLYAPTDLVFPAPLVEETARKIAPTGAPVETGQLPGVMGHLNGVVAIAQAGEKIKAFLEK